MALFFSLSLPHSLFLFPTLCRKGIYSQTPDETFPSASYIFCFLFHFNSEKIGYIFFYSPPMPLWLLLSFDYLWKTISCLLTFATYFPRAAYSTFNPFQKALKPILYKSTGRPFTLRLGLKCHGRRGTEVGKGLVVGEVKRGFRE